MARATDADVQATTQVTETGQLVGTLAYMSPEQVIGDSRAIDARTDVYALGVLLYELLCGRLPYEVVQHSIVETARIIREVEPHRLSAIDTHLRGDVETIVLKAMEKDPARRYATAADLAADIRRHLADQPIAARPASATYQLRKFARRHRALVGGALAVFVVLVAGVVVATSFAIQEARQRARAEQLLLDADRARREAESARDDARLEAQKAQAAVTFLQGMLASADPDVQAGETLTVLDALDRAKAQLEDLDDQPAVQAAVRHILGTTYASLGRQDEAFTHLRAALATRREHFGDAHPDVAMTLNSLAQLHLRRNEHEPALALAREALAIQEEHFPDRMLDMATSKQHVAAALDERGDSAAALPLLQEVLATRQALLAPTDELIPITMNLIAYTLTNLGEYEQAEDMYRAAVDLCRRHQGENQLLVASGLSNLAALHRNQGNPLKARELDLEALALADRLLDDDHPVIATLHQHLADIEFELGNEEAAEAHAASAIAARRGIFGDDHPLLAVSLTHHGFMLQRLGRLESAEAELREALAILRRHPGDAPQLAYTLYRVADVLAAQGRFAEAESFARECLETQGALYGPDDPPIQATRRLMTRIQEGPNADPSDAK